MSSSAELTLGRPFHGVSHEGAFEGGHFERMLKLECYLKALEDERSKIEAFKRELPFCMQLLNEEIKASKEQLADDEEPAVKPQSTLTSVCEENLSMKSAENVRPVLEEFIPIKKPAEEDVKDDTYIVHNVIASGSKYIKGAKPNGVILTKFWTPAEAYAHGQEIISSMTDKPYKKRDNMRTEGEDTEVAKPILNPQKRGGAFVPFCGSRRLQIPAEHLVEALPHVREGDASPTSCTDMARSLTVSGGHHHPDLKETQNVSVTAPTTSYSNGIGQATQRKPRRCWSPELHRRFVNALQQLGGSEATPKQIRELMKVDGLTNDEVKSHLQKYRLHTRRPNPSFHAASAHAPQVVVLGGIWVPPEYAAATVSQAMPHQLQESAVQAATASYSEERYIQLNTTTASAATQLQLHPALYGLNGEGRPAVTTASAQSQGSSQGPALHNHHLSSGHSASDAGGREEAESEDGNESWKDEDRRSTHEANGDSLFSYDPRAPLHVHKWLYTKTTSTQNISGDDDSEAEDGRVYETPM